MTAYAAPKRAPRILRDASGLAVAVPRGTFVDSPTSAAAVLAPHLQDLDHEEFWALLIDTRNRVIAMRQIAVGGLTMCAVDPRVLFAVALRGNAVGLIVAHNHPSGDPTPSADDRSLTRRIADGARTLGLTLMDHVIIGGESRSYSFAEEGVLP